MNKDAALGAGTARGRRPANKEAAETTRWLSVCICNGFIIENGAQNEGACWLGWVTCEKYVEAMPEKFVSIARNKTSIEIASLQHGTPVV